MTEVRFEFVEAEDLWGYLLIRVTVITNPSPLFRLRHKIQNLKMNQRDNDNEKENHHKDLRLTRQMKLQS